MRDSRGGRGVARVVTLVVSLLAVAGLAGCDGDNGALAERQAEVAARGAEVMPFDLDATTHRFEPTETGLVQTVTADDPDDGEQIALIRAHLEDEASRFTAGDFDDPAAIHGEGMPGLTTLRDGAAEIDVQLEQLVDGARLVYTTDNPSLIEALRQWAAAQVSDHGEHAEHGN
ncbi:MAG TPA: hypothetical protein VFZ85_10730 [Jiangellaceae bacterium]